MAKKSVKMIPQAPYSPDLAPADFFLFPKVKTVLGGTLIEGDSVRTAWERAVRTIDTGEFLTAFNRWLERQQKCIRVGGEYVEKC